MPKHKTATVFIYGSLLPGQDNHRVVSRFILDSRPGRVAGRLVDFGPYPAMLRDEEAFRNGRCVRGIWIDVDAEGLRNMDELEDFHGIEEMNDYERVWAVDADRPERSGWVYVWDGPRGCAPIESEYWPDYITRKNIADRQNNERPPL